MVQNHIVKIQVIFLYKKIFETKTRLFQNQLHGKMFMGRINWHENVTLWRKLISESNKSEQSNPENAKFCKHIAEYKQKSIIQYFQFDRVLQQCAAMVQQLLKRWLNFTRFQPVLWKLKKILYSCFPNEISFVMIRVRFVFFFW